jgi:hypothetical protein
MSSDSYRSELVRIQKEAASLHSDLAKSEQDASRARAEASKKLKSASDSKSLSSAQSYLRSAEYEERKASDAQKKIADIRNKLSRNSERQQNAERNLASALKRKRDAADRAEDQKRRKDKSDQEARDRETSRRHQKERDHAREISRLSSPTIHHVLVKAPEPERLRVLYLTSSPGEGDALRVDAEVNNVLQALRGAKHRDLIELFHRPAARPQDLMDGINDIRPHVVHFSGHGGPSGLLFDNASLSSPEGQAVGFGALSKILRATSSPPTLAVLNACKTIDGADPLLEAVPVVIAMADTVGDMSAGLFATHFYAAIAAAQSIGHAVDQARAMVSIALPHEPDLVTVCVAPEVEVHQIQLVKPS